MNQLVKIDTNALNRAFLGFDQLFDSFEQRFSNQLNTNYPPYNIIKHNDNLYELELAVTGFTPEEITVEVDQNQLVVKGVRNKGNEAASDFIHRGLAFRDFTRSWTLAEHMEVDKGSIKNGVLKITINRVVPETLKPRVIAVKAD